MIVRSTWQTIGRFLGLRQWLSFIVFVLSTWLPALHLWAGQLPTVDINRLLEGVDEIAAPGVPGQLAVFGHSASVLVVGAYNDLRAPVVAAATWGKGKVLALAHDGYFKRDALSTADTGKLFMNAVLWCGGGRVGVFIGERDLHAFLNSHGIPVDLLSIRDLSANLRRYRVLCFRPSDLTDELLPRIAQFVQQGGGLIVAETGWGWLQLNPGKTLHQSRANKLLHQAGIVWTDGVTSRTSPAGFRAGRETHPACHANTALTLILGENSPELNVLPDESGGLSKPLGRQAPDRFVQKQAIYTLQQACRFVPIEVETFWNPLRHFVQACDQPLPTLNTPITEQMSRERLRIVLFTELSKAIPPEEVRAHPAAADFPGSVPDTVPRRRKTVLLDPRQPGWQSTGCYAPPGEVITALVEGDIRPERVVLQIGSHSDTVWHADKWHRMPEIIRRVGLQQKPTRVASPFGGLVYVEFVGNPQGREVWLTLSGVVDAPYFVHEKTELAEWQRLVNQPVPWAELASEKIVLTLPTFAARRAKDPRHVLNFWNRVLDACAELAAQEAVRTRPERIVTDRQISAGYMHAGYPIMTHLDVAELLAEPDREHTDPRWGIFHEIGHNHQSPDWTFPEVSEVTCNLFTVYILERVCGMKDRAAMHPGLGDRQKRMTEYFAVGPSLEKLGQDPFLALIPYLQLQEAFGWETYRRVFAQYRQLPAAQRPRTTQEKIDQWVIRFSKEVGRNLAPFHRSWGFPVSPATEESLRDLPIWFPPDFPPGRTSR
ncbi:MAG: M60 family metallopeptidase [Thermoguttaceae bacterium]|nr:M60 family metallopeptidase [Thermoguttaceae bacterium]MDW8077499.1 M60 family metallopeptidase [Thermoguttaceae bacterium]